MRKAARIDSNQREIVAFLKIIGASVTSLAAVGRGCPDLLVGFKGMNYLFEIKGEKGKVSNCQQLWHASWNGMVHVIRSVDDLSFLLIKEFHEMISHPIKVFL